MNRTAQGMKNTKVALIYYIISMFLGFISRKIFIEHIGAEVLGLNTTAQNLLGFLNLSELGIGTAVAFTLYKPLSIDDKKTVSEIITVQGWLYRRIALFVGCSSIILMAFFPLIFSNIKIPIWYAYASFLLYLYSSLLTYFTNYKQILLSANQEEYKITYSYKYVLVIQSLCQIVAIKYFNNGYLWWLFLHFAFSSIASYSLNRTIKRSYPDLNIKISQGREFSKKYPIILLKIKQVFVHKIAGFVLSQTSPLIIFLYTSLSLVAIYGNYMLIVNSIVFMFQAMFNGVTAGVGNLVAEGNKKKVLSVFEELFSSRFLCATTFCYCIYVLSESFITIWIGKDFVLDKTTVVLIIGIMYVNLTRTTVDAYLSAYGLYQDIYSPIIEAGLNLGMSLYLGYLWGINGVLLGIIISLICVVLIWKPFFLYTKGLKEPVINYILIYARHIFIFACSATLFNIVQRWCWHSPKTENLLEWAIFASFVFLGFILIEFSFLYIFTTGMRNFTYRIKQQILKF